MSMLKERVLHFQTHRCTKKTVIVVIPMYAVFIINVIASGRDTGS